MRTVRYVLENKGYDVWSVEPGRTVFEALEELAAKDVGALVVMEEGKLRGIFSERDYARKVALKGRSSRETAVKQVMTSEVVCVKPSQSIDECMALMTNRRIRHLPVLDEEDEEKVVGLISIGDVVKEVIAEQEFRIEQLENYISGDR